MPAVPYRLQVLKALTTHLEGITKANGYDYELGTSVFRGRAKYGDDDPIPMLAMLEAPTPPHPMYGAEEDAMSSEWWTILVQGWAEDDTLNPTDPAYYLMDAVEKRLSLIIAIRDDASGRPVDKNTYLLGGLIAGLQYGPGIVRPPTEQVSSKAFFYLPVRVKLAGLAG